MPEESPTINSGYTTIDRIKAGWGCLDSQEKKITVGGGVVSFVAGGIAFGAKSYEDNLPDPEVHAEIGAIETAQAHIRHDLALLDDTYNAIAQKDNPAYIGEIDFDDKPHEPDFSSLSEAADNQHLNEDFQAAKKDPEIGKYIIRVAAAENEDEAVRILVEAQDELYTAQAELRPELKSLNQKDTDASIKPALGFGAGTFVITSALVVAAIRSRRIWKRYQKGRIVKAEMRRAGFKKPKFEDRLFEVMQDSEGAHREEE